MADLAVTVSVDCSYLLMVESEYVEAKSNLIPNELKQRLKN